MLAIALTDSAIALGSNSESKGSAKQKHIDRADYTLGSGFSSSSVIHRSYWHFVVAMTFITRCQRQGRRIKSHCFFDVPEWYVYST